MKGGRKRHGSRRPRVRLRRKGDKLMFANREDAALQLAARLRERPLRHPLVLAIPRGGVVLGAVLARELDADLDVLLARKLRAPDNPELALGAVSETGKVYLNSEFLEPPSQDRKSTRLNSSHLGISYAVFCL